MPSELTWVASTFFLAGVLVGIGVSVWFLVTFVFEREDED
jgi:hypothetical protein